MAPEPDVIVEAERVLAAGDRSSLRKSVRYVSGPPGTTEDRDIDDIIRKSLLSTGDQGTASSSRLPDEYTLQRDVKALQLRLHNMNRLLLNPHSTLMQYWDFCTLTALFFTASMHHLYRVFLALTPPGR